MSETISIPTYAPLLKVEVPVKQTAVERSLARPDAFAKPGTVGKVRVRTISGKPKSGSQRIRKRDPRRVHFF